MDGDRSATSGPTTVVDDGNNTLEMDIDNATGRFRLEESIPLPAIASVPEHPPIDTFDEDIDRLRSGTSF